MRAPQFHYELWWQNFDKIVLIGLLLILVSFNLHMIHHGADNSSVSWMEELVGQILSALLAVMGKDYSIKRRRDAERKKSRTRRPRPAEPSRES